MAEGAIETDGQHMFANIQPVDDELPSGLHESLAVVSSDVGPPNAGFGAAEQLAVAAAIEHFNPLNSGA